MSEQISQERRPRWLIFAGAAALTAFLFNLTYFPVGQGRLAWFALVPWLILVRAPVSNRTRYILAWLSALAFFLPALRWMRVAHEVMVYSWIGLALVCSWFAPLAMWLIRRLDRRHWPLTLSVPVVWTALEFVRTHILGGFPWYFLGHSQHDFLHVIQIADLAGVPAVTFLVAAMNGCLAELCFAWPKLREPLGLPVHRARFLPQGVGLVVAFIATFAYGEWRLRQNLVRAGPTVALLQTDLEQSTRNSQPEATPHPRSPQDMRLQTAELTRRAAKLTPAPDLIIWPETTFEYEYKIRSDPPPHDKEYLNWVEDIPLREDLYLQIANASQSEVLLGLNSWKYVASEKFDRYNSALLLDRSGRVVDRYDKTHLVPFGEYVPLVETIPMMQWLAPYDEGLNMLSSGNRMTRMRLQRPGGDVTFGCLICYEDSYAHLARAYMVGPEPPVDFLVNQSNDGWFKCTHEHEEHLAVSRFRAIECRRALVRAANMGISAIIDGNGRILVLPVNHSWSASKGLMTVVSGEVPIDTRTSLYSQTGDVLPWLCWAAIAVGILRPRKAEAA